MDKLYHLRALVRGLHRIVGGERAGVVRLVSAELIRTRSVIAAALSESKGMVSEAICNVRDRYPVDVCSDAPGPLTEDPFDQA